MGEIDMEGWVFVRRGNEVFLTAPFIDGDGDEHESVLIIDISEWEEIVQRVSPELLDEQR